MAARSRSPYLNTELVIELFPAFVFFAVNLLWDFRTATVATLGATILAVVSGILLHRRLPLIAIAVVTVVVCCLGGFVAYKKGWIGGESSDESTAGKPASTASKNDRFADEEDEEDGTEN